MSVTIARRRRRHQFFHGDPSEPHTDANAIVKGNAEMKTP